MCNFMFSSSISNFSYEFFSLTGIRKGTNIFNGPANLQVSRKFHRGKRDKFYLKDLYFLCRKTLRNGIELRQDRYLSMRRLSNRGQRVFIKHLISDLRNSWTSNISTTGHQWPCILLLLCER